MSWWGDMDLTPWCSDYPAGSTDFDFAVALANERARRRGVRQRLTVAPAGQLWPFVVADVTEPARPALRVVAS